MSLYSVRKMVAAGLGLAAVVASAPYVAAQIAQGAPPPPAPTQTARAAAPVDLSGNWVSVVTEDWQWRFITPAPGDFTSVPLNSEGDKVAKAWNPEADVAAGNQCKPFGAAAIMRLPTRLRVAWTDDNTMKLDWDLGTQSRAVYFDKSKMASGERTWQGHAVAEWIDLPAPGGRGGGAAAPAPAAPGAAAAPGGRGGAPAAGARGGGAPGGRAGGRGATPAGRPGGLKITTTHLRAQYLRMNGVPVSERATVTDYLDLVPGPGNTQWLIVKTVVDDPTYLTQTYITSAQFKKEADGSKWTPTPCQLLPRAKKTATQVPRANG